MVYSNMVSQSGEFGISGIVKVIPNALAQFPNSFPDTDRIANAGHQINNLPCAAVSKCAGKKALTIWKGEHGAVLDPRATRTVSASKGTTGSSRSPWL